MSKGWKDGHKYASLPASGPDKSVGSSGAVVLRRRTRSPLATRRVLMTLLEGRTSSSVMTVSKQQTNEMGRGEERGEKTREQKDVIRLWYFFAVPSKVR